MNDEQRQNKMELVQQEQSDIPLKTDLIELQFLASDTMASIEQQYQKKLKCVQINEIQTYNKQLQKELEEEQTKLLINKDQIKILCQEIDILDEKIEDFRHQQYKLQDEQQQQTQQISQSYNYIEYILKQVAQVYDKDFTSKQLLDLEQQDHKEAIESHNQLIKILINQKEEQKKIFINIEQKKQKLYMQIEKYKQVVLRQQAALNQYQTNKIDKEKFFSQYEDSLRDQLININQNIQETNEQIRQFNDRKKFESLNEQEQNQINQEANQLQDEKNQIYQQYKEQFESSRSLKQKIRNTELNIKIYCCKQLSIKQSINFTQSEIELFRRQINLQNDKIQQLQNYILALGQQLIETERQLKQKEQEFQEKNYFKILEQLLTYNKNQNQIKQLKLKLLQLKGRLKSAENKLNNNYKKLDQFNVRLQRYEQQLTEYQNNYKQLEDQVNQQKQNHQDLQQDLNQVDIQIIKLQDQEQVIRCKKQKINLKNQEITQMFYMSKYEKEITNLQDQLLKELINLQDLQKELEIIKRDNILLYSLHKFDEIGQNFIYFIKQTTSSTLQQIQKEEDNYDILKDYQMMLNHRILETQDKIREHNYEIDITQFKFSKCDQIDYHITEIDTQLDQTLKTIEKYQEINGRINFRQTEINEQVENLKQQIDEKNNSMQHIKLKQSEIYNYIEIIQNQLCEQEQLYEIEITQQLLSKESIKNDQIIASTNQSDKQLVCNIKQDKIDEQVNQQSLSATITQNSALKQVCSSFSKQSLNKNQNE
ncbi:hypothetical protein pb186bvf_010629 [Paramecium bursaria]